MSKKLSDITAYLATLNPASRTALKEDLSLYFNDADLEVIDTHNTKSILFVFTADEKRYGLKIEYGEAKVIRDEVHWYSIVPDHLKKHFVASGVQDMYAFVLLHWLEDAQTIEQLAIAENHTRSQTAVDAYLEALRQDAELFASANTVPLETGPTHGFFRDKFYAKLEQAAPYQYLVDLLTAESLTINNKLYPGPQWFINRVHYDDALRTYLSPERAGFIHGDLHADNLLVLDGEVYMVDPNGLDYLPIEYDHGRVYWSLRGWNAIVRDEFKLGYEDGSYMLETSHREQYKHGKDRIREFFTEQEYHRALYSAAMQFLSRADHADKKDEATALHLRGIEVFGELFDELTIQY